MSAKRGLFIYKSEETRRWQVFSFFKKISSSDGYPLPHTFHTYFLSLVILPPHPFAVLLSLMYVYYTYLV